MKMTQQPVNQHATSLPFFRTPGMTSFGNQPSNISYGSLYNSTSRPLMPPPPPPRNLNHSYASSYSNPYSSPYYSTGSYGNYPSYNNRPLFSSYPPYSRSSYITPLRGGPSAFEPSFIEEAQESSREAFASIESIVSAFGSINMMIESTYHALHSSFNAVLSVAENMSRIKLQFGQVLSAFTVIRSLQWLYRKLLYLIGLRNADPSAETAWKLAARGLEEPLDSKAKKSSWPIVMFFIAVYAGPFLMWKFINSILQQGKSKDSWGENGDYYYAIAKYKYDAQSAEELSFSAGEYLKLAPYAKQKDKSWPLASNGKRVGVVPINYIDVKFKSAQANDTLTPRSHETSQTPGKVSSPVQSSVLSQNEVQVCQKKGDGERSSETIDNCPSVHETSKQTDLLEDKSLALKDPVLSPQNESRKKDSTCKYPRLFDNKSTTLTIRP